MDYSKKYDFKRAEGKLGLNDSLEINSSGQFLVASEFPGKQNTSDPASLLLTAVTGSTLFTVINYARSKGWTIKNIETELAMLSVNDSTGQWIELFEELRVDAYLLESQIQELLKAAAQSPLKALLNASIPVTTVIKLKPGENSQSFRVLPDKQIDHETDNSPIALTHSVDFSQRTAI